MFASIVVALLALITAPAPAPLTIEDYATTPQLSAPRLSPDGSRVVYVLTRADMTRSAFQSELWLVPSDGQSSRQLTAGGAIDNSPEWSPDGERIAFLSDRDGATSIYLIDPDGGEAQRLTKEPVPIRSFTWSADSRSIGFARSDLPTAEEERRTKERDDARVVGESKRHVHLHLIDVDTRRVNRVTGGDFSVVDYSLSSRGVFAVARARGNSLDDYYRTDLYTVPATGGELRPLVVQPGIDRRPLWSPDGSSIAFVSGRGVHDWLVEHDIHIVSADGGKPRLLSESYGRIPESLHWTADGRSLIFDGPLGIDSHLFRLSVSGGKLEQLTTGNRVVDDTHIANGRAVFVMQTLTAPPEIFVADLAKFVPRQLTNHNAALRNRALGETRIVRWKNPKDGLAIEGLLTLPIGYRVGERVPLVTFVHGGPASRFDTGFLGYLGHNYAPQVLASRGIAILRPNPRGTGGYGAAFRAANRNDWGGMDWVDINAGVDAVIAQGIADPERLGIMGWSYGGFMTAHALGASDRFKAVSIGAPVVDLLSFHGTTDIRDFIPHYFDRRDVPPDPALDEMRHAPLSLELLRAHSPLWHLKKTNAKVLIQHGENDDRVPLSQGLMLYRMLDELGVDVTMAIYPRSGHGIREPRLRMDVARRNVELFVRVLGSRGVRTF